MPSAWESGWEVYSVLVLAALLAAMFPIFLYGVAWILSPRNRSGGEPPEPADLVLSAPSKMNTRVFIPTNTAILLLGLALILVPCVSAWQAAEGIAASEIPLLVAIFSIIGFCLVGLLYAVAKKDLSWFSHFRKIRGK